MEYYRSGDLLIRDMTYDDARAFTDEERAQGWHADISKYEGRLKDRAEGRCTAIVAELSGKPAGYISVYPNSNRGAFGGKGLPEIVDFGVLIRYRNRGVGSRLMDVAERIAAGYADAVYLGVGLHEGYGSAQRMYVKRGYIPDGSGVWYGSEPCDPYGPIPSNDDDLVLYMSKKLDAGQTDGDGGAAVRMVENADEKTSISRAVLEALTDWFEVTETREAYIRESAAQPFFAAFEADAPVGFLCLKETGKETMELAVMGVLKGYHRRGIGQALFRAAKRYATEKGYDFLQVKTVRMGVYDDYDATNRFYLALGFKELEVFPTLWDEANPCQVYVMALKKRV